MYHYLIKLQEKLAKRIIIQTYNKNIQHVAGIDVAFLGDFAFASICVLNKDLKITEIVTSKKLVTFPYIPGLLSFREMPAIFEAYKKLKTTVDLFIIDGQGIAHPRDIGIASHMGVIFNVATIGCAKSKLSGIFIDPNKTKNSYSPLYVKNKIAGVVFRSRENVKPIFISPGNLTDVESSVNIVKLYITRYRLPEPTRYAHIYANKAKKNL
jgi:deoxyribonuclease V